MLPLSNGAYAFAFVVQWLVAIGVVVRARMWRRESQARRRIAVPVPSAVQASGEAKA
jgi:hypothetical protein